MRDSSKAALPPALVATTTSEAGSYPFLTHSIIDAERGAYGRFRVTD